MPKKSSKPEGETVLATFRINAGLWRQFQAWAKEQGNTASSVIIQSIHQCLDGNIYISAESTSQPHIDKSETDIDVSSSPVDIDKATINIDRTGIDIDVLNQRLAQQVVATLEGGLLAQLLNDAVSFALDDRMKRSDALIQQMEQVLDAVDLKVEEASKRATNTAAAFIDGQIEKAIAPLTRNQSITSDRLVSLQERFEFAVRQGRQRRQEVALLGDKLAKLTTLIENLDSSNNDLAGAVLAQEARIKHLAEQVGTLDSRIEMALMVPKNNIQTLRLRLDDLEATLKSNRTSTAPVVVEAIALPTAELSHTPEDAPESASEPGNQPHATKAKKPKAPKTTEKPALPSQPSQKFLDALRLAAEIKIGTELSRRELVKLLDANEATIRNWEKSKRLAELGFKNIGQKDDNPTSPVFYRKVAEPTPPTS